MDCVCSNVFHIYIHIYIYIYYIYMMRIAKGSCSVAMVTFTTVSIGVFSFISAQLFGEPPWLKKKRPLKWAKKRRRTGCTVANRTHLNHRIDGGGIFPCPRHSCQGSRFLSPLRIGLWDTPLPKWPYFLHGAFLNGGDPNLQVLG